MANFRHNSDILDAVPKSKKQKKKKSGKTKSSGDKIKTNGIVVGEENDHDGAEGDEQGSRTPTEPPTSPRKFEVDQKRNLTNGDSVHGEYKADQLDQTEIDRADDSHEMSSPSKELPEAKANDEEANRPSTSEADHSAVFQERIALREEVAQIRRSLDDLQEKHAQELDGLQAQLAAARSEKEQAEAQYRGLLGKVSTIRSQLGERLKADAVSRNFGNISYWC